mmetsp:Transcript_20380/g.56713  ORF Transcript_20380/g.56713 Transcript_20380/m.56713 type:complete len:232 (-) Transcript_20380:1435-2130(-)
MQPSQHDKPTILELTAGTLLGFKAAPGSDATQLFEQAAEEGSKHWSAIYVQLDLGQAIRYIPNQYDRGATMACILAIRLRKSMQVLVLRNPAIGDTTISSNAKAAMIQRYCTRHAIWKSDTDDLPLLPRLGRCNYALCLMDSEDYELAVPHRLCTPDLWHAEPSFLLPQSRKIPCTIGGFEVVDERYRAELKDRPHELSDAGVVGDWVCSRLRQQEELPWKVGWLDAPMGR